MIKTCTVTPAATYRYQVSPVATEQCDSLRDIVLHQTNDLKEAERLAAMESYRPYGAGILDLTTGVIDVGFGFGVPCETGADA